MLDTARESADWAYGEGDEYSSEPILRPITHMKANLLKASLGWLFSSIPRTLIVTASAGVAIACLFLRGPDENLLNPEGPASALANLDPPGNDEPRISRFRLTTSESSEDGADSRLAYWLGARDYTDNQLQKLAENIIEHRRERDPFLSMAEYVNRRLESGEIAQRGALQQAIDDSGLSRAHPAY